MGANEYACPAVRGLVVRYLSALSFYIAALVIYKHMLTSECFDIQMTISCLANFCENLGRVNNCSHDFSLNNFMFFHATSGSMYMNAMPFSFTSAIRSASLTGGD